MTGRNTRPVEKTHACHPNPHRSVVQRRLDAADTPKRMGVSRDSACGRARTDE